VEIGDITAGVGFVLNLPELTAKLQAAEQLARVEFKPIPVRFDFSSQALIAKAEASMTALTGTVRTQTPAVAALVAEWKALGAATQNSGLQNAPAASQRRGAAMNTEATYARMLSREVNTLRNNWQSERVGEADVVTGMQKYGRQAQINMDIIEAQIAALKGKSSLNVVELKQLAELTTLQDTYSRSLKGTASTINTINGVVTRGSLAAGVKLGVADLTIALKGMTEQTMLLQDQERAGIITKKELSLALTQQAGTQRGVLATIDAEILATRNLGIVQLGNVERLTQLRTAQSQYTAALASTVAAQQASAGLSARAAFAGAAGRGAGLNNASMALSFVSPQAGMVAMAASMGPVVAGAAAVGLALGSIVKLTKDGQDEAKKLQQAYLVMSANGIQDLKSIDAQLNQIVQSGSAAEQMFSKSELATALAALARGGVKGSDALTVLGVAAKLAAAEHVPLNDAVTRLYGNLQHLDMTAQQAAGFGDMLARASHLSLASMDDLSKGLNVVGATAHLMGFSLEETLAMLVRLAQKGMDPATIGSTGLRNAMQKVLTPSKEAAVIYEELGVKMRDANGHMRSGHDIMTDLREVFLSTTPVYNKLTGELINKTDLAAMAFQIFHTRSSTAFLGVTSDLGHMTGEIKNSSGFLNTYSGTVVNGLEGAQKRLKTATDNLSLAFAQTFTPSLTRAAEVMTDTVRWVGSLGDKANEAKPYLTALGVAVTALTVAAIANSTAMKELMLAQSLGGMANVATVAATAIKLKFIPAMEGATAATTAFMALNPVTLFALAAGGLGLYVNSILDNIHKIQDEVAKTEADVEGQQQKLWNKGRLGQLATMKLQIVQADTSEYTPAQLKRRQETIAKIDAESKALQGLTQAASSTSGKTASGDIAVNLVKGIADSVKGDPKINAWCADVAGQIINKLGYHLTRSANAAQLEQNAIKDGWVKVGVKDAKPGDLVVYAGAGYGKTSGHHTEVVAGQQNGKTMLVGANTTATPTMKALYDPEHATVYRSSQSPWAGRNTPAATTTAPPPETDPNFKPPPIAPLKALQTEFTALKTAYAAGKMDVDAYHSALERVRSSAEQLATTQKTGSKEWTATEGLIRSTSSALKAHAKETDDLTPITAAQIAQAQRLEAALKKAQDAHDPKAIDAATSALKRYTDASASNARAVASVQSAVGRSAASGNYIASASDLRKYGDDALKLIKAQEVAQKSGDAAQIASSNTALEAFTKNSKARASVVQLEQTAYSARQAAANKADQEGAQALRDAEQEKEKLRTESERRLKESQAITQALRAQDVEKAQGHLEALKRQRDDALKDAGDNVSKQLAVQKRFAAGLEAGAEAIAQAQYKIDKAEADSGPAQLKDGRLTVARQKLDAALAAARSTEPVDTATEKQTDAVVKQREAYHALAETLRRHVEAGDLDSKTQQELTRQFNDLGRETEKLGLTSDKGVVKSRTLTFALIGQGQAAYLTAQRMQGMVSGNAEAADSALAVADSLNSVGQRGPAIDLLTSVLSGLMDSAARGEASAESVDKLRAALSGLTGDQATEQQAQEFLGNLDGSIDEQLAAIQAKIEDPNTSSALRAAIVKMTEGFGTDSVVTGSLGEAGREAVTAWVDGAEERARAEQVRLDRIQQALDFPLAEPSLGRGQLDPSDTVGLNNRRQGTGMPAATGEATPLPTRVKPRLNPDGTPWVDPGVEARLNDPAERDKAYAAFQVTEAQKVYTDGLKLNTVEELQNQAARARGLKDLVRLPLILAEIDSKQKEATQSARSIRDIQAGGQSNSLEERHNQGLISERAYLAQRQQLAKIAAFAAYSDAVADHQDEAQAYAQLQATLTALSEKGVSDRIGLQRSELEKFKSDVQGAQQTLSSVFAAFGASDAQQQGISSLFSTVNSGIDAVGKFASGDIIGGVESTIGAVLSLGDAIQALDPAYQLWKKNTLEQASAEQQAMGSKMYGNIANPYYDKLKTDSEALTTKANAGFWQRLGWSLFGGAPETLDKAASDTLVKASNIFSDFAQSINGTLEGVLIDAADNADFSGVGNALDKQMNKLIQTYALRAIIAKSNLSKFIQDFADDSAAGKDTTVDLANIRSEQGRITSSYQAIAPSLPGYGSGSDGGMQPYSNATIAGAAPAAQFGPPELQFPAILTTALTNIGNLDVPGFNASTKRLMDAANLIVDTLGSRGTQRSGLSGY